MHHQFMKFIRLALISLFCLVSLSPLSAQSGRYTIQIAATPTQTEAEEKVSQLKARGLEAYWLKSNVPGSGVLYRVRIGRFATISAAQAYGEQLRRQGIVTDFFPIRYEQPPPPAANRAPNSTSSATPKPTPPAPMKEAPRPSMPAAETKPTPAPKAATEAKLTPPGYVRFEDKTIGYSFAHPSYWTGGTIGSAEGQTQSSDAGAVFRSEKDHAFLSAIWNMVEGANRPSLDNDLIAGLIVKSMSKGPGTQSLIETSRRMMTEGEQIKTFIELRATFHDPQSAAPLDFLGQAVIIRARKGILLVATFYAKDSPPQAAQIAESIIHSAWVPE